MNQFSAMALAAVMYGFFAPLASASDQVLTGSGDPTAGEAASAVCASCHGADGNSVNPAWPSIAGQGARYLAKQLHDFKNPDDSGRNNPMMAGPAAALSDDDIANLAAFFAVQKPAIGVADPELLAAGEALYRAGDRSRRLPACTGCHSPRGLGNPAAGYPRLSGQHADYTAAQLKAFRSGDRANDDNQMMRDISQRLSDADIDALAAYLQGLH